MPRSPSRRTPGRQPSARWPAGCGDAWQRRSAGPDRSDGGARRCDRAGGGRRGPDPSPPLRSPRQVSRLVRMKRHRKGHSTNGQGFGSEPTDNAIADGTPQEAGSLPLWLLLIHISEAPERVKCWDLMPVTPEAAGSSPVDPAILRSPAASFGWQAKRVTITRRMSTVARSVKVDRHFSNYLLASHLHLLRL
jgi:hypothetical protein